MRIAYFPNALARNADPVLQAFLQGCESAGIETRANCLDSDVAVIWSVLWAGRMASNQQIYQHYQSRRCPVIAIDIGTLHRGITWKIAVNNINSHGYYGHEENLDWDRPKRLGIALRNPNKVNPAVLIALQHQASLQTQHVDLAVWLDCVIKNVTAVADRPVVVRPHPRAKVDLSWLPKGVTIQQPKKLINTYDSFDIDYAYHSVINFNSGPGIQAALSGARPIVDSSSLAWPVSIQLTDIDKPYTVDRDQWLTEICHTEYTVEEIKQGIWLKRIQSALPQK